MFLQVLREELGNDPEGYGYAPLVASGADYSLAEMLNAVRAGIAIPQLVPTCKVKMALIESGDWLKVKASTSDAAKLAVDYLSDPRLGDMDLTLPVIVAMFDALVAEGSVSAAARTTINALGTRQGSRAEHLGLGIVNMMDVAAAMGRG